MVKRLLNKAVPYIFTILERINILKSRRKASFLDVIICVKSIQNLFDDTIKANKYMHYVLIYKMGYDRLDMLFVVIRSREGFNNNPTAAQFEGAFKRLLVHNELGSAEPANCEDKI